MSIDDFTQVIENISEHDVARKDKVLSAISRLQVSQCADPQIMHLRSAATGLLMPYQVPCGKCYHCRETKLNEWVTRMCLETDTHKHCYFVTLTYRSYDRYVDIPDEIRDAFWHYDNNNKNGKYCWSPCLIRGEHVSQFMRNLRNDTNNRNIRFFCGSEFGSTYGRPHHHMILWSDEPIYITDVMRAWSHREQNSSSYSGRFQKLRYKCYADGQGFDYNDLYANGTLYTDAKATIDGQQMTAACAFKYVSKYLQKGADDVNMDAPCFSRLRYFQEYCAALVDGVQDDMKRYDSVMTPNVCRSVWNKMRQFNPNMFNLLPFIDYDQFIKLQSDSTYELYHKAFSKYFFSQSLRDFCGLFGFRTTMSRGSGIGSFYALENIQRFAQGNKRFSSDITDRYGQLVWPSSFTRKTKDFINPFIFGNYGQPSDVRSSQERTLRRTSFVDETYSDNTYLSKQGNQIMRKVYMSLLTDLVSHDDVAPYVSPLTYGTEFISSKDFRPIKGTACDIFDKWQHSHYLIVPKYEYLFHDGLYNADGSPFVSIYYTYVVCRYSYSRSLCGYTLVEETSLNDFVTLLVAALDKETNDALLNQQMMSERLYRFQAAKSKINHFGMDFDKAMSDAVEVANKERADRQIKYNSNHGTADNQ